MDVDPSIIPPDETPQQKARREKLLHREHEFEEEAHELVMHFNNRLVESLLSCIRSSLDAIKRRVFPRYVTFLLESQERDAFSLCGSYRLTILLVIFP